MFLGTNRSYPRTRIRDRRQLVEMRIWREFSDNKLDSHVTGRRDSLFSSADQAKNSLKYFIQKNIENFDVNEETNS